LAFFVLSVMIPIKTIYLFQILDQKLIELLNSLTLEDWAIPTMAGQWTVKEFAAHLLDGNLRTLSMLRDKFYGEKPEDVDTYHGMVAYLNRLNADWIKAYKRVSPKVLVDMLASSGEEYRQYLAQLNPFEKAEWAVAWAGETESENWFHIAREYTEKWHHQKQIREAVGVGGLMERELYFPLIQTFMMALPHTYRNVKASNGSSIEVVITGDSGGKWIIEYAKGTWKFVENEISNPSAQVELGQENAWKLFTKGLSHDDAIHRINFKGNVELGKEILKMVAVMA
jgi:uncharacterized protein (TIGR03083 family)